ncbi:MAG: hypothetical protein OXG81_10950 [Acidobacteria bacterium]|nr:hypothetical protein [Acidobacteriota bacterium]
MIVLEIIDSFRGGGDAAAGWIADRRFPGCQAAVRPASRRYR